MIRASRGAAAAEEDDEADEDEPNEAEDSGSEEEVAVAVLRASDALDLSAAARQLGWPAARLAPRSEVPRLLRYRFAPGGIPPLGHAAFGLRTLVCSRAVVRDDDEEEEEREGEEEQQQPRKTSFVAGGGDPALRLVFRGRGALAAAMEAEGAAVVSGLGVGRPPLVLSFSPGAASAAAAASRGGDDSAAASSPDPGAPAVYSSPPPLFADDAEGIRALAEILLPPSSASASAPSSSASPSSSEEDRSSPSATAKDEKGTRSNRQRWHFLGIDAEWVPERDRGASGRHPVETLQLATREHAAVLDVAALSRSREGAEALVGLLARAATAGTGVGGAEKNGGGGGGDDNSVRVLFVGHSARQDLVRLARTIAEASAARGEGRREGETGGESESDSDDGETPSPPPLLPLLTLPNLPVHSVDLPALAKWAVSPPGALVPAGRLPGGHGLANLVRTFLGGNTTLSKELQRSDWGARPLSTEQLAYAAADAHACVAVAERILTELRPELAATRKRAAAHSGGLTELDGGFSRGSGRRNNKKAGGSANSPLSYLLQPPPPLAPGPARDARRAAREERRAAMLMATSEGGGRGGSLDGSFFSSSSSSSNLERTAARRVRRAGSGGGGDGAPFPPPPVSSGGSAADADADVEGLLRDFLGLPLPGKGGRGLAVAAALGLLSPGGGSNGDGSDGDGGDRLSWKRRGRERSDDERPPSSSRHHHHHHLAVPRFDRGGVARLRNACVLFVNLDAGGGGGASRYPNEFVKGEAPGELRLTWFPSPGQGAAHPLVRRLLSPKIAGGERHSVLLFCRLRSAKSGLGGKVDNGPYYFLGRLGKPRIDWGDGEGFGGEDEEDEEDAVLSRASSRSSSRQYPAMLAWKLLDAEMAAARGGRDVEALFEAGAPRKRSTTTAVG